MARPGLYKIQTVSTLTGFSPELLRAWESRHGLLEPERTAGGHRLYTDDDLRVLRAVRPLLDEGLSIGEIAAVGRASLLKRVTTPPANARAATPPPGGNIDDAIDAIVRSALDIDAHACRRALDDALARWSARIAIDSVFSPALVRIGELWATGECSVAGEHLVSGQLVDRLRQLIDNAGISDRSAPLVVCACLPGEQHEFGIAVIALRMCWSGHRVAYLGCNLPLADLDLTIRRLNPARVLLSAVMTETFESCRQQLLKLVRKWKRTVQITVGGPGVSASEAAKLHRAGASAADPPWAN